MHRTHADGTERTSQPPVINTTNSDGSSRTRPFTFLLVRIRRMYIALRNYFSCISSYLADQLWVVFGFGGESRSPRRQT